VKLRLPGLFQAEMRSRRLSLGLALFAGAAASLAHPPYGVLPGLLGFGLLLHLLDHAGSGKSAFARGWCAGFAYFLVATWWVSEAFMVDAAAHAWQAPFAVTLLPAGLGLFWGLAGMAYRRLRPANDLRILVFAAVFGAAEWLRGHVLTGFPWDLPGEAWPAGSPPSQLAAYVGAYGLSFVTLAIAAAAGLGRRPRPLLAAAAALLLLWAGGAWRLSQASAAETDLVVRLVQPNIAQAMKWTPAEFNHIVLRYLELTRRPAARRPDVVVWPEAAIPTSANDQLSPDLWIRGAIQDSLSPGQSLLMGAYREEGPPGSTVYYNSLYALRRTAQGLDVVGRYDKFRLVPFGEYLPLERLLSLVGLKALVAIGESFTPGPRPAPISPPGLPRLQPLICYESLYPGLAADNGQRPSWIVNVSNDAWFGQTSGPRQHFNLASYRAIEAGLPLVRATPTGVSGLVDAYGRPLRRLASGRSGVIDVKLPARAAATPYSRWGDLGFFAMLALGFICIRRQKALTRA
jgi:apolipoprotein N-acyltransferase